jgi:hypothetical protein
MSKFENPFREIAEKSVLLKQGNTNSAVSAALTGV